MKIVKSGLHPIYDQYENAENRLTHALLHTIGSSTWVFERFLTTLVGVSSKGVRKQFEISTQKVPLSHGDLEPEQVESVPDAWIVDDVSKTGIAIEVKDKKDTLRTDQLRKHANRIRGYDQQYLLVITPALRLPEKITQLRTDAKSGLNIIWLSWDIVYKWLSDLPVSKLPKNSKESFLINSMLAYLERRREVLGFQGIRFRSGFNILEAKDILNAEMEELDAFVKKEYGGFVRGRPAITTFSQGAVWDCFGSKKGFTSDLHVTLSIHQDRQDISLTVPNSAIQRWRRLKEIFSDPNVENELFSILATLRKEVPHLFIEFHQRHFLAQRSGVSDGFMEFNIDALGSRFRNKNSKTKESPVWLPAIRSAIVNKKNVNGQVMFKARFDLKQTKGTEKPQFIETAKKTIRSFKPLYEFLKTGS